jgi:hypothetical protein
MGCLATASVQSPGGLRPQARRRVRGPNSRSNRASVYGAAKSMSARPGQVPQHAHWASKWLARARLNHSRTRTIPSRATRRVPCRRRRRVLGQPEITRTVCPTRRCCGKRTQGLVLFRVLVEAMQRSDSHQLLLG